MSQGEDLTHSSEEVRCKALLESLWADYCAVTPQAQKIHRLLEARGETVVNDHIALRTWSHAHLNIERLAGVFLSAGYLEGGSYTFPEKKLRAKSFVPPSAHAPDHAQDPWPRIFISELMHDAFGPEVQAIIDAWVAQVPAEATPTEHLMRQVAWPLPRWADYQTLLSVSEYAAWLYARGLCANHFTVSVNALTTFSSLAEVNAWLIASGFALNGEGDFVQGSPAELLVQSSTIADRHPCGFVEGSKEIPSCYYEFAMRYTDPQSGALFDGFVPKSANKIFESTDVRASLP